MIGLASILSFIFISMASAYDLSELDFISGCYSSKGPSYPNNNYEELYWGSSSGGVKLGQSKAFLHNDLVSYFSLELRKEGGRLLLTVSRSGVIAATFFVSELKENFVAFKNEKDMSKVCYEKSENLLKVTYGCGEGHPTSYDMKICQ